MERKLSVAVITPTIGRKSLSQAIESVKLQSYPCRHYIFIDGEQYHAQVQEILKNYPDVIAVYLPMNTGKNDWYNSRILAAAPFWVEEEIICYLDDDNTYLPNHIYQIVKIFKEQNPDYVYSLRNFVDNNGNFVCKDRTESIGFYINTYPKQIMQSISIGNHALKMQHRITEPFIDVNCYAFPKSLCYLLSDIWNMSGFGNDKVVFNYLKQTNKKAISTEKYSVNYFIDFKKVYSGNIYNLLEPYEPDIQKRKDIIKEIVISLNNGTVLKNVK